MRERRNSVSVKHSYSGSNRGGHASPKNKTWDFYKPGMRAGIENPGGRKLVVSPEQSLVASPLAANMSRDRRRSSISLAQNLSYPRKGSVSPTSPKDQEGRASSPQGGGGGGDAKFLGDRGTATAGWGANGGRETLRAMQVKRQMEELERKRANYPAGAHYASLIAREKERELGAREELLRQVNMFSVKDKAPIPSSRGFIRPATSAGPHPAVTAVRSASPIFKQASAPKSGLLASLPRSFRGEDGRVEGLTSGSFISASPLQQPSQHQRSHTSMSLMSASSSNGPSRDNFDDNHNDVEGSATWSSTSHHIQSPITGGGILANRSRDSIVKQESGDSFASFYTGSIPHGEVSASSLGYDDDGHHQVGRQDSVDSIRPFASSSSNVGSKNLSVRIDERSLEPDESRWGAERPDSTGGGDGSRGRIGGEMSGRSLGSVRSMRSSVGGNSMVSMRSDKAIKQSLTESFARAEQRRLFPMSPEGFAVQVEKLKSGLGLDEEQLREAIRVTRHSASCTPIHGRGPGGDDFRLDSYRLQQHTGLQEGIQDYEPHAKGTRRPPYAVQGVYDDPYDGKECVEYTRFRVPEGSQVLPHRGTKEQQFAWWSTHWNKKLGISGKKPPIKPVEKIWLGNFQKREVPLRKEQLGSFPSYVDFPWPPPDDVNGVVGKMQKFFEKQVPFGQDRQRFAGSGEKTTNRLMRDEKLQPDFLAQSGDLSLSATSTPNQYRPHSIPGWGGYKQVHQDEKYDTMSKRGYTRDVERLIGVVCDKLNEHGVKNYSMAFKGFDADRSGTIDEGELKTFFITWSIIITPEESKNLFLAFLDESKTKEGEAPTIDIFDFVNALNKHESTHPLDPFYKNGPSLG